MTPFSFSTASLKTIVASRSCTLITGIIPINGIFDQPLVNELIIGVISQIHQYYL